jgi:hypothetical protein
MLYQDKEGNLWTLDEIVELADGEIEERGIHIF